MPDMTGFEVAARLRQGRLDCRYRLSHRPLGGRSRRYGESRGRHQLRRETTPGPRPGARRGGSARGTRVRVAPSLIPDLYDGRGRTGPYQNLGDGTRRPLTAGRETCSRKTGGSPATRSMVLGALRITQANGPVSWLRRIRTALALLVLSACASPGRGWITRLAELARHSRDRRYGRRSSSTSFLRSTDHERTIQPERRRLVSDSTRGLCPSRLGSIVVRSCRVRPSVQRR